MAARSDGKLRCSTCDRALEPTEFRQYDDHRLVSDPDRHGRSFTCDDCWDVWMEMPHGPVQAVRDVVLAFNEEMT